MQPRTIRQATEILHDVLERRLSYREAGARHGIARSTAEKQAKTLVRLAASQNPIRALNAAALSSLALLRAARADVLRAVQAFDPAASTQHGMTWWDGEFTEALKPLRSQSENANRDVALLLLLFSTGAKPLEIAALRVRDYLTQDGQPRDYADIDHLEDGQPGRRPLCFLSQRLRSALDAYLEERFRRGLGVSERPGYRGLAADSSLFLTKDGRSFEVKARSANDPRPICPVLVATYRRILVRAGMPGMTMQSARRHVAQRLLARGATRCQVGELLGIVHQRSVQRLLRRAAPPIEQLVKDIT
jgi:integrase